LLGEKKTLKPTWSTPREKETKIAAAMITAAEPIEKELANGQINGVF